VQVVLPGDADAAVELDAVLDHLGRPRPDPRLGRADDLGGVGRSGRHRPGRGGGDGVACLEHHLVVGDAVLEDLVRRQRPPEGVPVAEVLDGRGEDLVHDPGGLRALERAGHLEGVLDLGRGAPRRADHRVGGDGHVVEAHLGEAAHEVDS
jgi:hypothetical protein